jgi:hypothetical protein
MHIDAIKEPPTRTTALCQVSNGSQRAKDRARSPPFSSVHGTAGCREADKRQQFECRRISKTRYRCRVAVQLHLLHTLCFPFCTYCHFMLQGNWDVGTTDAEMKELTNVEVPSYGSNRCHFTLQVTCCCC